MSSGPSPGWVGRMNCRTFFSLLAGGVVGSMGCFSGSRRAVFVLFADGKIDGVGVGAGAGVGVQSLVE